jgi:nicotinamidase/pyrazinamidase
MGSKVNINKKTDALIIIDIQNDFCKDGALPVKDGDLIIPGVSKLAFEFDTVILSQDWHPKEHLSFASVHSAQPFSNINMPYGAQTLWPDHCVQGSFGAQFHSSLHEAGVVDRASAIIRKGMNPEVDSYSAFFENDKLTPTGLTGLLNERGIKRVFFVGLAYDFCVGYSAIDAKHSGFTSVIVKDLTSSIAMPLEVGTTVDAIERQFGDVGVVLVNSSDFSVAPQARPAR